MIKKKEFKNNRNKVRFIKYNIIQSYNYDSIVDVFKECITSCKIQKFDIYEYIYIYNICFENKCPDMVYKYENILLNIIDGYNNNDVCICICNVLNCMLNEYM